MFVEEALQISKFIKDRNIQSQSVLNIGSGDLHFRTHIQPYIDEYIFSEFRKRNCIVTHLDLYGKDGIDIRMDINSLSSLTKEYDIVLCSNVFEHIIDRKKLGTDIVRLTKKGGCIIVTTPHVFPYHEDPIDTLFRPTVENQLSYLSGVTCVEGNELPICKPYVSRGFHVSLRIMKPMMLVKSILYKIKGGTFNLLKDWSIIFSQWKTTYIVAQKQ